MKSRFSRVICFVLALLLLPLGFLELAIPAKAYYENTYVNTGDQRADIIGVARTQVGYREGSGGYTKYGAWYGSAYMDWCGAFISWCANQAAIPGSVLKKGGFANPSAFGLSDVFYYSSGRLPQPGDLFFRIDSDGYYAHAGLVERVEGQYFYTLEGNTWEDGGSDGVYNRKRQLAGNYSFASPAYRNTSGHTHSYEIGNEASHPHKEYKYCAGCDDKTYTGNTKILSDCITCRQENCTHQYGDWKKIDNANHSATCSLCEKIGTFQHEWISGEILREPSCKEPGLKEQHCKQCGFAREKELPVTEDHTYGAWQYIDGNVHQMICEVCQKAEEAAHTQSQEQTGDELKHWYTCEDCDGRLKSTDHTFSGDCESACMDCGYVSPAGHMYGSQWETDGNAHWYACRKCAATKDRQQHVFSSDCDDTCNTCDYTRITTHTFSGAWKSNSTGHWKSCQVCSQRSEIEPHASDGERTEGQALLCSQCHYEMAAAETHTHEYTILSHDQKGHYGVCACGQELEATNHTWNPETQKCSVCQQTVPTLGKQSAVLRFAVDKVGNSPYLWLIVVLPLVAVLAILLLIILLILTIRKRSRDIEYEDEEYEEDEGESPVEEQLPEQTQPAQEEEFQLDEPFEDDEQPVIDEKTGMEQLSV